jgi:S1-C subfamily serine protease
VNHADLERGRRSFKHLRLAPCVVLLLASCAGLGRQPDPLALEAQYRERALAFLQGPSPERALDEYNRNVGLYPQVSAEVLQAYAQKQRLLLDRHREDRALNRMIAAWTSLKAVGGSDPETDALVRTSLLDDLKANRRVASLLALQYQDPAFPGGVATRTLEPLLDYEGIACHVLVHWTRRTVNGVVRTDSPYFTGSGFLIDRRHVVTAYHVVEAVFGDDTVSWSVEVKKDGVYHKVEKLVGYDAIDDIAVLELGEPVSVPENIIALFGDSATVPPGFEIYCLGDPQGFELTWTRGIVSATARRAPEMGSWMQIDAAVSSGASGGLVLGADGRIYGMVVAGSFYGNINFAVPSRTILERLDRLLAGEAGRFPWLGLLIQGDFEQTGKLVIADVFPSSPLVTAGVETGDTLHSINGVQVKTVPAVHAILRDLPLGGVVRVAVGQGEKVTELYVPLPARPEYALYNATRQYGKERMLLTYFGFRLNFAAQSTRTIRVGGQSFRVPTYPVQEVRARSEVEAFGVRAGDRIGILLDNEHLMRRYIDIVHFPKNMGEVEDQEDMILELTRGAYDENIL